MATKETPKQISEGTVHKLPADLKNAILSSPKTLSAWEDISAIARNEWICWVESVKKEETRLHHIKRAKAELAEGKRRPCCWIGCVHRTDKSMNATQKWVLGKQNKKSVRSN
ncbi:MAG: YdeI/OmpD-associated family protein [Candidatus Pacebacteria bacterium]|nr:YdeI/OmpD-associated family protein [Candidatus Paceibacterota bacterium]MBP9852030.1 YdeI/OmpD-associated family protein [Candidatus Paceibacterota bacterium]